ncbi:leukocyte surface antigen CD53-like [Achroia grisella]|uniref:leukocyte surface antigen CD53-like n=1 Tax=Achroia grisella TaxID=688607 RepID=UPI0027D33472|nr:leukocyte surface antigen CD53-like [Achroia grisella]
MKFKVPKLLKSVRYSLGAINGLFLVTGIIMLITGVAILVQYLHYELLITDKFFSLPRFAVSIGVIIILVSILGFYGAVSESFYFIAAYVVLLIIVLIFEMSVVIVSYGLKNNAASEIRATMEESRQLYGSRREITIIWDDMQMNFECCGVAGRHDWSNSQVPVSCCYIEYGTVSPFECGLSNAYTTGCAAALGEWLSYKARALAITSLIVTCLQVLITAAAAWLAYRSKYSGVELES